MFDALRQDVRHGVRMLAKAPGFTAVAVLSMAIGVGANAAMFSVADGLVLRPLPVPDADGLMRVRATTPTGVSSLVSYPDYADLRERARSFTSLAVSRTLVAGLAREPGELAQSCVGLAVSTNFFDTVGVQPALGRGFTANEDRSDARATAVILSHELWTREFGAARDIVGRHIRLATADFTVVGVMPATFKGIDFYLPAAFYVPVRLLPSLDDRTQANALERRDVRSFRAVGRLKPGVTLAQAGQEVEQIGREIERLHPELRTRQGLQLRTDNRARFDDFFVVWTLGVMLIGLAVAVLLVACANVTGLLMSRAPVRARELALRIAIGGSRERLVRQLITEAALLALAGGGAGLAFGYLGILSFQQFQIASDSGITLTYALDRRALAVALTAAVASALLSSLVPAWRATRIGDLSTILRQSAMPATRAGRLWGRHGLVAGQVGLTLVLLTMSVMFYRAFAAEYGRGPGFTTDHILLASMDPSLSRYDPARTETFYRQLEERVSAIPGVSAVGQTSYVPLSQDGGETAGLVPEGVTLPVGTDSVAAGMARVDAGYLDAIGIPIVSGRGFDRRDTADAPRAVIINHGLAERLWPGQPVVGKRLRLAAGGDWMEIVGVAADHKFRLFTRTSTPFIFVPRVQQPLARSTLVIRTTGPSVSVASAVRTVVADLDPEMPVVGLRTMEDYYYANAKNLNVVVVRTIGAMGAMGLVLALIGLYALMAYAVSRRRREIGIRLAVGAAPASVLYLFLRQASVSPAVGVVVGVALSAAVGGALKSVFPGTAGDAVTYAVVVPLVVLVAMMAAYLPARSAARIDPLVALREE